MFRLILFAALVAFAAAERCTIRGNPDFRSDPDDCSVFYVCALGNLVQFKCPKPSVFDPLSHTCVPEGSSYDRCTSRKEALAQKVVCLPHSRAIIAHPLNCAQYYNCSAQAQGVRWEDHLQECEHPRVFNEMTKRCEHYSMVKCGKRTEPLSHCDYRRNQCEAAHCRPCNVRFPSCKGLPDGLNQWVGREGSPYYVVCEAQRMIFSSTCSQEFGPQIFDPVKKMCVEPTY